MFNRSLLPFHGQRFSLGHNPTNWPKWLRTEAMYTIRFENVRIGTDTAAREALHNPAWPFMPFAECVLAKVCRFHESASARL
jgi:hypothetical protein